MLKNSLTVSQSSLTVSRLCLSGKATGEDFGRAAFIFQHGDTLNDYLLAHALAMVSVARGQSGSSWIAAASLDRYLQSVGKPQIFGTQFLTKPGQPATQEPYDGSMIPDSLREYLSVPLPSEQEQQRKIYDVNAEAVANSRFFLQKCVHNGCTIMREGETEMKGPTIRREIRLSIRTTLERKALLTRAAEKEHKNISDFVLDNALSAAEAIVSDDANHALKADKWNDFLAALDAPPRRIPALKALLNEPSVLDAK